MNQIVALKGSIGGMAGPAGIPATPQPRSTAITTEIRPLTALAALVSEWSDLSGRALEPNLFAEPDFVLAAAQHLVAFRDAAAVLAWDGPAGDPGRRLIGLLPCAPRTRLFAPGGLSGLADDHILDGAPLLDRARAGDVVTALLRHRDGGGLSLRRIDLDGRLAALLRETASGLGSSRSLAPAPRAGQAGTAAREALARQGKLKLVEASTRSEVRDAVEIMLAMDASGARGRAGKATLQNTREAGFLRAMTRALARTRQCRVGLLMLDERPVAAAILLGRAQRLWLYATAEDEVLGAFDPGQMLLALLREAAPARMILRPDEERIADLHWPARQGLQPRGLAQRASAALRRAVLNPRRAGAA